MSPKEQQLADTLVCPNCGRNEFIETHTNAALGFRCDCGLEFNFMPMLRQIDITRDPRPELVGVDEKLEFLHEPDSIDQTGKLTLPNLTGVGDNLYLRPQTWPRRAWGRKVQLAMLLALIGGILSTLSLIWIITHIFQHKKPAPNVLEQSEIGPK